MVLTVCSRTPKKPILQKKMDYIIAIALIRGATCIKYKFPRGSQLGRQVYETPESVSDSGVNFEDSGVNIKDSGVNFKDSGVNF